MKKDYSHLIGVKKDFLTPIKIVTKMCTGERWRRTFLECKCDCGNTYLALCYIFDKNKRKIFSCGCKHVWGGVTHGKYNTSEYRYWAAMKQRCYSPKNAYYHLYGGRGVSVCDQWKNSFTAFIEDMGQKPTPKHTIDRIDTNGNYEPGNCRWATAYQQANNQRNTILVEFNGKTQSTSEWSKEVGISKNTIYTRIRNGWTVKDTLTKPITSHNLKPKIKKKWKHLN